MTDIKSIEQLLHFMSSHIHLSRYDEKFIENISTLTQVTTNQVILFHSLLDKYRRQFAKHELYPEHLVNLPWDVVVVDSSPKYTNGYLEIVNDMIYFKCPFNRKFIESFRKEPNNQFIFNKDNRRYEAQYNQYSLKILLKVASNYFKYIDMCPVTQELLSDVEQYNQAKYWQPTLVKLNNRLYIVAMNPSLNEALGDIELKDDLQTLSKIAGYGITIDESLYDKNNLTDNVSCNYEVSVEQRDIPELTQILKYLECDMVYVFNAGNLHQGKRLLVENLNKHNIGYYDSANHRKLINKPINPVKIKFKGVFFKDSDDHKITKSIHIVNSTPIDIK
jgi:hypothetical protein